MKCRYILEFVIKSRIPLSESNKIRTHHHLLRKPTLNHLAKSSRINTQPIRIMLLSLKLQIWHLLQAKSSWTFG